MEPEQQPAVVARGIRVSGPWGPVYGPIDLTIPAGAFLAGLGDHTIVTTLCPGGKERMRRLMEVIASGRLDTRPLVTHRFTLDRIEEAYDLFANQRDGVLKVAITP